MTRPGATSDPADRETVRRGGLTEAPDRAGRCGDRTALDAVSGESLAFVAQGARPPTREG